MHVCSCLIRVSTASVKHYDQNQVGEERVYLAYMSTLLFITRGRQDRNSNRARTWRQGLMQRPWRVLLTGLLPLVCSACFLIEPKTTSPEMAPPTMGPPTLDHQPRKCPTARSHGGIFSREAPFSVTTPTCVKLTHRTSQYSDLLGMPGDLGMDVKSQVLQ